MTPQPLLQPRSAAPIYGGPDLPASAARRTCRISSSWEAISANEGHAAITWPVAAGSATATFAARLAALPATSRPHGRNPPRPPDRDSASSVVDAATIIPSTDIHDGICRWAGWA